MTYASTNRRPNPVALAGALGIPGAVGALLVVGLAVTVTVVPVTQNPEGRDIPTIPLPPPPPPKPDIPQPDNKTAKPDTSPNGPIVTLPQDPVFVDPFINEGPWIDTTPGTGTGSGTGDLVVIPDPGPPPQPFKPVGVAARGNPGNWVTNADYRPRWIRENLTGSARFSLSIDANGKVTNCTITRSTGHAALDEATCQLVTKRARFDAARDGNGKPVAGTYSNTVNWNIPE